MDNVVIFDGICHLCTNSVHFIIRHERDQLLRFAPLQSATGARLMRELGIDPEDVNTFVLLTDGRAFVKSDAAIRLARYLRGRWRLLGAIKIIPRPIRDWIYDVIARNRYRWFGRADECMVPAPDLRARFIED